MGSRGGDRSWETSPDFARTSIKTHELTSKMRKKGSISLNLTAFLHEIANETSIVRSRVSITVRKGSQDHGGHAQPEE
jgi:hypothetical protein